MKRRIVSPLPIELVTVDGQKRPGPPLTFRQFVYERTLAVCFVTDDPAATPQNTTYALEAVLDQMACMEAAGKAPGEAAYLDESTWVRLCRATRQSSYNPEVAYQLRPHIMVILNAPLVDEKALPVLPELPAASEG